MTKTVGNLLSCCTIETDMKIIFEAEFYHFAESLLDNLSLNLHSVW